MSNIPDKQILTLWKMVVQQIQPLSTRLLLEKQCQLIKVDIESNIAEIAITSKSLAKLVHSKIPTIEKAFEEEVRKPIKVILLFDGSVIESEKTVNLQEVEELISLQDVQIPKPPVFLSELSQQNNQGLGAPYKWKGLYFRSKSEIKIAEVLDQRGVLFFPNVRGRVSLNGIMVNREIDFLICHHGSWGIFECDGEEYHQTAANDHARDMVWNAHRIWFIKRFSATECYNYPEKVIEQFLDLLRLFESQKHI